ncbi:hypothetical protein LIER_28366 [Lithospermum erythrorhizon]|uniref:Uncharacterized protein n=1 Tax=Lithospermum erythrorhizon TaxID=34254 RepID=A0AAV3RFF2_LITER
MVFVINQELGFNLLDKREVDGEAGGFVRRRRIGVAAQIDVAGVSEVVADRWRGSGGAEEVAVSEEVIGSEEVVDRCRS